MKRIASMLSTNSAEFQANLRHNRQLAHELHRLQDRVRHHRPERDLQRLQRQGKLLVR